MPEFTVNGRLYYNPVDFALHRIGGVWKMPILWRLNKKTMRFSEISKSLPRIADKTLSVQLKELEEYGLIERTAYPEVPPRVEYSITEAGKEVIPVINMIRDYGFMLMEKEGIAHQHKKHDSHTDTKT